MTFGDVTSDDTTSDDTAARALTLEEAAVRHGAYRWAEQRLFELTGSWAAAPGLPDPARVLCFEASAEHAWHAELWEARLPVLAGVDRERLTRPVGRRAEALLEALSPGAWHGDDRSAGVRFVVGLARVVLPVLLASYRRFGECLVPVSDGPAIRALDFVVRDEEAELRRALALLDELLSEPDAAREAAVWTGALDEPRLRSGGEEELFPWSEGKFAG